MFKKKQTIVKYNSYIWTDKLGNETPIHNALDTKIFKSMRNDFLRLQQGRWFSGSHSNEYKLTLLQMFGDTGEQRRPA